MQRASFSRFTALMALAAAAMASGMSREQAISNHGGYQSRGKRKTKAHDNGGTRAFLRQAKKRRNRIAHRRACR